ncbi:MAG: tetratricopeptide repeat protein, partial [Anaerolineales bacterium]|nr:tetratricopeptide repeat protein [Anaerolineales bacterium]
RMMGEERISFIFSIGSSGRKLETMQASYTEFFKTALYKKISFLSREQTAGLIRRPVEGLLEYDHEAVGRIFDITSGHPYFTQLTCHELFSLCQRTGELRIGEKDVEAILEDVVERGTVNLKFTWDEASDIEKWNLATLAQHDEPLNNRALADLLREQRVRFSDSDLTSCMLRLREKDILTEENRFVIYLLKLWLKKNRTLEQVREELTEVNPIANRYIEIGLEFQDSGLYDKAIENFREALAVAPDNIQAQVNIAQAYMTQGALNQAVTEFEKALDMDDEDVASRSGLCEAYLALGDAANEKGKTKEAIQFYQKVMSINAEHTEARQRMAEISRGRAEKALADGRDEEALAAFAEALKFTPEDGNLSARYEQAKVEKRTKVLVSLLAKADKEQAVRNWESALKILENALEIAPGEEKVRTRITTVKAEQRKEQLQVILSRADRAAGAGRWGLVIAALEEYLTLEPEDAKIQPRIDEARRKLTEAQVEEARARARGLARQERFEEAIAAWNEYLKINPSDDQTVQAEIEKVHKAQTLVQNYAEAQKAFSRKNYEKAVSLLRSIVVENADYKDATRLMAEAIELRRTARKWWQSKWLWAIVGSSVVLVVVWFAFRPGSPLLAPPSSPPLEITATTGAPLVAAIPTNTPELTSPPAPTPTPLPYSWTRLNSGQFLPRDQVTAIVVDPTDAGVIYVGTAHAGIYKSIDGGASWQPKHNEIGSARILSILLDSQTPNVLYASVEHDGVYKTINGAETWQAINNGIDFSDEFTGVPALDVQNSQHIYYTTGINLYETMNGGEQWDRVSKPVCPSTMLDLVVDPNDGQTLYLVNEMYKSCKTGIYKSNNAGKSWDYLGLDEDDVYNASTTANLLISRDGKYLYVKGADSVFVSSDGGQSWSKNDISCRSLALDEQDGTVAYCGQQSKIAKTEDGGQSWETLNLLGNNDFVEAIFALDSQHILAGSAGLYFSTDGGNSWKDQNSGLGGLQTNLSVDPWNPSTLYIDGTDLYRFHTDSSTLELVTRDGYDLAFDADGMTQYRARGDTVLRSQDQGATWTRMNLPVSDRLFDIVANPKTPKTIYAAFSGEGDVDFSSSTDGGVTWEGSSISGYIWSPVMYLDQNTGNTIYAVGTKNVFRSTDSGKAWRGCLDSGYLYPTSSQTALAIHPENSAALYLATRGGGILISSNGCDSWLPSSDGLGGLFVNTVAIDPNDPDTLYAGTDGGAYISTDGGQTWGQVNDGLLGATVVYSIAVDKDSNVYAATPYGIFKLEGK